MPQEPLLIKPHVPLMPSEKVEIVKGLSEYYKPYDTSSVWGQEMICGWSFAQEGDFYRAITCFRKATFLFQATQLDGTAFSESQKKLYLQATTGIITSYVLSDKYAQAIEAWHTLQDKVSLQNKAEAKWLLLLLVEAYSSTSDGMNDAIALASLLPFSDPDREKLFQYLALRMRSKEPLSYMNPQQPMEVVPQTKEQLLTQNKTENLFQEWQKKKKSPKSAAIMNLLLPGSGYLYLGQYPTAFTSLALNSLFIGATVEFFKAGQPMAGVIALGLELGWWGGGATGSYLQAQQYNHKKWVDMAERFMKQEGLYPEALLWNDMELKLREKRSQQTNV